MGVWENRTTRFLGLGVFLCLLAILFALVWSPILKHFMKKELALFNNSSRYKKWETPPIPMYMNFHFFNWTNPEKVLIEKPAFTEMGPYRYVERRKKVNVTFNANGTVSYRVLRTWNFLPNESRGTENDMITTLNGIAVAAAHKVQKAGYFPQKSISMLLTATGQTLAVTRPLRELLFEGYLDPLITIGKNLPGSNKSPYDRFGWFIGKNNSYKNDGYYNINTGVRNIGDLGVLKQWNYSNRTKHYPGKCANIYGSSGDLFPPGQTREGKISLFSADVCRPLDLVYEKDEEVEGIAVYKYEVDRDLLDNGTKVPGNECFCNGDCVPSGLLNITQCRYGVPVFISFPHFLHADPVYLSTVDGLSPDPEKHSFYMSVEPTMGIPLEGAARIQVNLLMSTAHHVSLFKEVPTLFIPVMWVEHKFVITPEIASKLRIAVLAPSIGYTLAAVIFFTGIAVILVTLGYRKSDTLGKQSKKQQIATVSFVTEKSKDIS